ncbi:uncharacterized protein [Epargyreus clarus]
MSHNGTKVERYDCLDTTYTCGESNKKKKQLYQEENNNEVDELSKEFSEMGCIVDAVKRPPNVCIETCVYESGSDNEKSHSHENDDVHYSDEFEEDSDVEEIEVHNKSAHSTSKTESITVIQPCKSSVKLTKSQSSMSSNKPPSLSGRSDFGSVSVPSTRRINMSFTNERLREIERHNHILLNKILSARNSRKSSIPARDPPVKRVPPAAVHRKLQQRKIDHDNMILLKKIQRAKSSACSVRR